MWFLDDGWPLRPALVVAGELVASVRPPVKGLPVRKKDMTWEVSYALRCIRAVFKEIVMWVTEDGELKEGLGSNATHAGLVGSRKPSKRHNSPHALRTTTQRGG